MTVNEFMEKMLEAFPHAQAGEDNEGQLIIYSGLYQIFGEVLALDELGDHGLRQCDGCGKIEDAGTYPDQDGEGRSECCW